MNKTTEDLLIINLIGFGVLVVATAIALSWSRAIGGPVDRDEKLFILKIFLAIWVFGNVMFFIMK